MNEREERRDIDKRIRRAGWRRDPLYGGIEMSKALKGIEVVLCGVKMFALLVREKCLSFQRSNLPVSPRSSSKNGSVRTDQYQNLLKP